MDYIADIVDCPLRHKTIRLNWVGTFLDYVEWVYGLYTMFFIGIGRRIGKHTIFVHVSNHIIKRTDPDGFAFLFALLLFLSLLLFFLF